MVISQNWKRSKRIMEVEGESGSEKMMESGMSGVVWVI